MRREKKLFGLALGVLMSLAMLTGCGEKAKSINVEELASKLASDITYQDELAAVDLDTASMIFNFGDADITKAAIYEGSGATAEEIAVLECATAEDAKKVRDAFGTRISEQKESFKDYVPEELEKLDKAIAVANGCYAVLSVSNEPDKAYAILDEYK